MRQTALSSNNADVDVIEFQHLYTELQTKNILYITCQMMPGKNQIFLLIVFPPLLYV